MAMFVTLWERKVVAVAVVLVAVAGRKAAVMAVLVAVAAAAVVAVLVVVAGQMRHLHVECLRRSGLVVSRRRTLECLVSSH